MFTTAKLTQGKPYLLDVVIKDSHYLRIMGARVVRWRRFSSISDTSATVQMDKNGKMKMLS